MTEKTLTASARDAVHNFTHYAAMVDAGTEVIIKRRGRASLKLVRADAKVQSKSHKDLIETALAVRASKPFKGKFKRSEAYDE
jgi:antitoxin (DNA-binding transcriptional repressor) of toxin-antitoxin stability system